MIRTLETPDNSILAGCQLFYNYIRPHIGLDGKTPVELAGIQIKGQNKWLTLIQNASKRVSVRTDAFGNPLPN